jgi:hypothetical protein
VRRISVASPGLTVEKSTGITSGMITSAGAEPVATTKGGGGGWAWADVKPSGNSEAAAASSSSRDVGFDFMWVLFSIKESAPDAGALGPRRPCGRPRVERSFLGRCDVGWLAE